MHDFIFGLTPGDIVYDLETFNSPFTAAFLHVETQERWYFEISNEVNQFDELILFIAMCQVQENRWVGFNNVGFDYPIIHYIWENRNSDINHNHIKEKANQLIELKKVNQFAGQILENDMIIPQLDLMLVHHFDNMAKLTSLKKLEFNMRMDNIEELPFPHDAVLNEEQKAVAKAYNWHDVEATYKFYEYSKDQIKFRDESSKKYPINFTNFNDTKIGKKYFEYCLEKANPGCTTITVNGRKKKNQTPRKYVDVKDVILPYVEFKEPGFQRALEEFKAMRVVPGETKGQSNISTVVKGFQYDMGRGGIHGSIQGRSVYAEEGTCILDLDVASYYPNLAIKNNFSPEHLGQKFCEIYDEVYQERKKHKKGTVENAMLKLALNGVFGDSQSKFSIFYDLKYFLSITINGQLLLCMLAEALIQDERVEVIQINTDGITIKVPEELRQWVLDIQAWWEDLTQLELECVEYKAMHIKNVNNYVAEYTGSDKLKLKNVYEYGWEGAGTPWHKNLSNLIIRKAAVQYLTKRIPVEDTIKSCTDIHDFTIYREARGTARFKLASGDEEYKKVRYVVTTGGDRLVKRSPPLGPVGQYKKASGVTQAAYEARMQETEGEWCPTVCTKNKSKYEERLQKIESGRLCTICNKIDRVSLDDIDYDYYIHEANKLIRFEGEE